MNQDDIIDALHEACYDKARTEPLVERLAAAGPAAVPELLAALPRVDRRVMVALVDALRMIGPPAFDAALAARARAEKVPNWRELEHVLRAFDVRCLDRYIAALDHPIKGIRQQALGGLENLGPQAAPAVAAAIPFLDDPDSYTRYCAENAVRKMGRQALPRLREIRRQGPAHLRRHALTALAILGGLAALDERDVRAVERLVRIKVLMDVPQQLPDHSWLAVPGQTYEGVFEAMGLHDRQPCTVSMGLSAMGDDLAFVEDDNGKKQAVYRVFVTPELDGWRLVYADTALREREWNLFDLVARVSAACGEAQVYDQDDHCDSMIWAVGRGGSLHRSYCRYGNPEWQGEPMEWEEPVTNDPKYESASYEPNASLETAVEPAASALSLYPADIDKETPMRGHGWLAVTAPNVGHGIFTGALRV